MEQRPTTENSAVKDVKENPKQKLFLERHEAAVQEQSRLESEVAKHDFRDFQPILDRNKISDETVESIVSEWLKNVRVQTDFLKPLDELGIRIFADDLECQGAFPGHTISFASKRIELRNLIEASHIAGLANVLAPVIEIAAPKPDLRQQLFSLLSQGHIGDVSETVVHELVHRYHLRERPDIHGILTEAQAYLSGIYGAGKHRTTKDIAETLTRKADGTRSALYEFDADATKNTLEDIIVLYATGKTYEEVARLIMESDLHADGKRFEPLSSKAQAARLQNGLETLPHEKIEESYRVHAHNELAKARVMLFSAIEERIPLEELREMRFAELRTRILHPTFFVEGKPVLFGEHMGRRVVCPINEKYPYDPQGKRSGIVFGFFDTEGGSEPNFKIGRWQAEQTTSETFFPIEPDGDEEREYISELRGQADLIKIEDKKQLALLYAKPRFYQERVARATVRALVTSENWRTIIAETLPSFKQTVDVLLVGVEAAQAAGVHVNHPEVQRRLASYDEAARTIQAVFDYSGISPENVDGDFASKLRKIEFSLDRILK